MEIFPFRLLFAGFYFKLYQCNSLSCMHFYFIEFSGTCGGTCCPGMCICFYSYLSFWVKRVPVIFTLIEYGENCRSPKENAPSACSNVLLIIRSLSLEQTKCNHNNKLKIASECLQCEEQLCIVTQLQGHYFIIFNLIFFPSAD